MSILLFLCTGIIAYPLFVRGGGFHGLLVDQAADILRSDDWQVMLEHPLPLPDGKTNYVDVYAKREGQVLLIEVETTPRYAQVNVAKAQQLHLPLWLLTPDQQVRSAIIRRLNLSVSRVSAVIDRGEINPLCILLHAHFSKALRGYSSFVFHGECSTEKQFNHRKTNQPHPLPRNRPRNKSPPS